MGLRIQNNIEAFNAHRQLSGTAAKAAKAMEKLSSGYRVNRAADDAAGLAISITPESLAREFHGIAVEPVRDGPTRSVYALLPAAGAVPLAREFVAALAQA